MPSSRSARLLSRVGPVRQLPVAKLLAAAEIILLARRHMMMLEPQERRRLMALVRQGHGRRRNLSAEERAELAWLVAKAHPRQFAGLVAQKVSPVRLPRRVVWGKR